MRILKGKIYDAAVYLRKSSAAFGEWVDIELSGENKKQLWIQKGVAHCFSALSEIAILAYKYDKYHHPEAEAD